MTDDVRAEAPQLDALELKTGFSYLLVDRVREAYMLFRRYAVDLRGLCITRVPPDRVREEFGIDGVAFRWLTHVRSDDAVRPTDLHILFPHIQSFMRDGKFIILLDGLEYLKVHNGFDEVLKFIQSFRDQVYLEKGILLVPVAHDALTSMEIALMRRELTPIEDVANQATAAAHAAEVDSGVVYNN